MWELILVLAAILLFIWSATIGRKGFEAMIAALISLVGLFFMLNSYILAIAWGMAIYEVFATGLVVSAVTASIGKEEADWIKSFYLFFFGGVILLALFAVLV